MGDHGFLRSLDAQVRRFNLVGDTTWCRGKVVDKREEDGKKVVICEIWCEDQRGDITAKGMATVELPTKQGQ
jgi:hypothetical protein